MYKKCNFVATNHANQR